MTGHSGTAARSGPAGKVARTVGWRPGEALTGLRLKGVFGGEGEEGRLGPKRLCTRNGPNKVVLQ